jgi:nitroreductase
MAVTGARSAALFLCAALLPAARPCLADDLKTWVLPTPQTSGGKPLMQALSERRTAREYRSDALPPQVLANLLWAAFGINRPASGGRTAPSAHDAQEISIYVVTAERVYLYEPRSNALVLVLAGDVRALTGRQAFVKDAPVNLVYVADFDKFPRDSEADRIFYSAADAGFISQNVYLYCASAGLATMVRAYIDKPALAKAMLLKPGQHVVLAQSVGYPK